ncbi:putative eukaryotic cytochrome b561 [Lyophyllum shimeji]|uniref:Eukaryotic cytochrome b561 n=1 Tax=Lyophyllum shimeji TaxID=47721 RepID=A0A9P3PH23_LYOSH|nr:putative eukaryotic cytochrome b561 [Lyophyllum shimeji]
MLRSLCLLGLAGTAWLKMLPPVRALQGDGKCGLYLCVNATVHEDMVTYEMTGLEEPLGWLALGWGTRMEGSQMIIMWPNDDGSTTLSHRRAFGHTEPLPSEYPPRHAKIAKPRVSTLWHPKAVGTLAFTIPVNKTVLSWSNPTERLIWAYSKVRPDKPPYSELTQHYSAGFLRLDLGGTMPEFVPTVQPAPHEEVTVPELSAMDGTIVTDPHEPFQRHERIIIAHGVLASFGFLVLLPAGSLVARWGRTLTPKWFSIHQTINMSIAAPLITIGWILGPIAVMDHQATHLFDAHQITGVFLLILYYLQVSLGRYIHRRRANAPPNAPKHPASNVLHVALGLFVITLAFVQTRSGMEEWKIATGRSHISHWCHDLWNIWVVVMPVAYLAGTFLLRRQFYQERYGINPGSSNYLALSPSPGNTDVVFEASDDVLPKEVESNVPLLSPHSRGS